MTVRVLPCGDRAVLLEVAGLAEVLALDASLRSDPPAGVVDIVPAARTVLLRLAADADLAATRRHLDALTLVAPDQLGSGEVVEIPTSYDGADLDDVASLLGLARQELVAVHTGQVWTVAFCGFAPGFAYLTGADERLASVPRLATPRTRVPAGSVALAGGFSAVYPSASPGGWQLIGRTDRRVFDVDRDPPALLRPGTRVRFTDRAHTR